MARPLDGVALLAYTHRLKLSKEAYELLTHIRSSPPSRTPGARRAFWQRAMKRQTYVPKVPNSSPICS